MKNHAWLNGFLLLFLLILPGCATVRNVLPASREQRVLNGGYSLLYKLLSQESDAAKLLFIKHADPPIADLIKEIARTCAAAKQELDQFQKSDRQLNFATPSLPKIEMQTRAAIESTETKQLLFSSGKQFEVRFLFTQAQAMNYAAHLAKVLQAQDANAARQKFLVTLAEQSTALQGRVLELLKY